MPYVIPTFNLTCNIWHGGNPVGPPSLSSPCNLAWGRRVNVASTGGTTLVGVPLVCMSLLLPKLTDIRGRSAAGGEDAVEVPAGSGRFYGSTFVDDIGKGFANEHRCAILQQMDPFISPIP
jgi:hypothetical protein